MVAAPGARRWDLGDLGPGRVGVGVAAGRVTSAPAPPFLARKRWPAVWWLRRPVVAAVAKDGLVLGQAQVVMGRARRSATAPVAPAVAQGVAVGGLQAPVRTVAPEERVEWVPPRAPPEPPVRSSSAGSVGAAISEAVGEAGEPASSVGAAVAAVVRILGLSRVAFPAVVVAAALALPWRPPAAASRPTPLECRRSS
jgi:hypothetical protein